MVRGLLAFLAIFGQAIALDVLVISQAKPSPLLVAAAVLDSGVTMAIFPLCTLLLLSALSPICLVSGMTRDVDELLQMRRAPRRGSERRAADQIEAIGAYASRSASEASRDAYRLAIQRLVGFTVAAAKWRPSNAQSDTNSDGGGWATRSLAFKWLAMAGDSAPMLALAQGHNVDLLRDAPRGLDGLSPIARLGVRSFSLAIGIESQTVLSRDPLSPVEGIQPLHAAVTEFLSVEEKTAGIYVSEIADAYVVAWLVGAGYAMSGGMTDVQWRATVVLSQCVQLFNGERLALARRDAVRALSILRSWVLAARSHPLARWTDDLCTGVGVPELRKGDDPEVSEFLELLFPELRSPLSKFS